MKIDFKNYLPKLVPSSGPSFGSIELVQASGPPFCTFWLVLASEPLDYLLELGLASGLPFCTRWIVPASGPLVTSQLNEIFDNVFFVHISSKYLLFFIIFLFLI